ncbi:DUF1707 SHOCT-like domain-containing protein [Agromyces marinus]|uniref:DUF1707 SHOCT-like domain-containing protein n=1 Tax=Agromyces marinus TaxID=1389020 RepID=UPI001F2525F4|nr:DUF1707 domain-containing protein [Agromyces marinus]
MSGYAEPDRPQERLSDAEREEAVVHLASARAEGRLTAAELADRSASARAAATWGDLVPLFADLPRVAPRTTPPAAAAAPTHDLSSRMAPPSWAPPHRRSGDPELSAAAPATPRA